MDEARQRISLGMKNLDVGDDIDILPSKESSEEANSDNGFMDDGESKLIFPETSLLGNQNMDIDFENKECSVLSHAESRASIPPLEVNLDDMVPSNVDDGQNQGQFDKVDTIDKKKKRQAKKKPKKERSF